MIVFFLIIAILSNFTSALGFEVEWNRTFGTNGSESGDSIVETDDGYVVAGTQHFSNYHQYILIFKINFSGDLLWNKTFNFSGFDYRPSIAKVNDGYVTAFNGVNNSLNTVLMKVDLNGNLMWNKTLQSDSFPVGIKNVNGSLFIGGSNYTTIYNYILIKADSDGNRIWTRKYNNTNNDFAYSYQSSTDNGHVIIGNSVDTSRRTFIVKTDFEGNEIWRLKYDINNKDFHSTATILSTSDESYIAAINNITFSSGINQKMKSTNFLKINSSGHHVWNWTYEYTGNNSIYSIQETANGDYIFIGNINTSQGKNNDLWIIQMDSNGNVIFSQTFGGTGNEVGMSSAKTSDGGYIIVGNTSSFGAGSDDMWVIKLKSPSPIVNLTSPSDNQVNDTTTLPLKITFNCSAESLNGLVNLSLYLTDSKNSSFALNRTANISSISNSSQWEINLTNGTYTWNCLAYDKLNKSSWGANRTLKISKTNSNTLNISITSLSNNSQIFQKSTWLNVTTDKYARCSYFLDSNSNVSLEHITSSSSSDVEGDAWKVQTPNHLELSEDLTSSGSIRETIRNITTFIDKSNLAGLDSGSVTNDKGTSKYNQYMYLLGPGTENSLDTGYVIYTENDEDQTADFLYFKSGREIARYLLEFVDPFQSGVYDSSGSPSVTGLFLKDFEDKDLKFFGKTYTITSAKRTSQNGSGVMLTLLSGAVRDTLLEQQTKSYTVNSKNYTVTLNFVDADEAQFVVNSQTTSKLKDSDTYKLSDGTIIGVTEVVYQDYAGGIHTTTFFIGANKLELKDTNLTDVASTNALKVDDNTIDDAYVIIEGSDNNITFKINRIHVNMTADDNFYVPANGKLSDTIKNAGGSSAEPEVLFTENWDIEYKGLKSVNTEKAALKTSGTSQYNLEFTDANGNKISVPIAKTPSGTNLFFGEETKPFINRENMTITKDSYFVITDSTKKRGERKTLILQYKGADKVTADNPALKFKDIGSGTTIEQTYINSSPLATLNLIGTNFKVYSNGDLSANDFNILIDMNGNGTIDEQIKTVNITTRYGAEIGLINLTNGKNIILSVKTPDEAHEGFAKDSYENLRASDFVVNISATGGKVQYDTLYGYTSGQIPSTQINLRTPDGQTNVGYGYTSYGSFIKRNTPIGEPATFEIDYPESQRYPLVYITTKGSNFVDEGTKHSGKINDISPGNHNLYMTCEDSFANSFSKFLSFNFNNVSLVKAVYPKNNSQNVSVNANLIINFSRDANKSTLKPNIILKDYNNNELKGFIINNDNLKQVVFDPIYPLKYNTTHKLVLLKNLKDSSGDIMEGDYIWNFTTEVKDTDNDGIPDDEDADKDNDGIDDNLDFFRGNLSNLNSNYGNLSFMIDSDFNISKQFNGTKKLEFRIGNNKLLEFDFNFSPTSVLDFSNLSILNASNSSLGGVVIRGVDLSMFGYKKTAFVERTDSSKNGLCIKDEEIDWIDNITDSCTGSNEFKIECDGSTQSGYTCTYNSTSNMYRVTGLSHSGVVQLTYTQQSSSGSSGSSSSSSGGGGSGGGGGGGGSGLTYICNMEWKCGDWSECKDGWQTRECNFVKVAQHVQKEPCGEQSKIPETSKKCEIKQAAPTNSITISPINEIKQPANKTNIDSVTDSNQITGGVVAGFASKSNMVALAAVAIISITGFIFYKKFRKKK